MEGTQMNNKRKATLLWPVKLVFCIALVVFLTHCDRPSPSRVSTTFNTQDANNTAQAPYLLPKCFDNRTPDDLIISISAVGADGIKNNACNISRSENNKDFALQWSQAGITSETSRIAEIGVRYTNVFSDKTENRSQLKNSFFAFRQQLSALEEDKNNNCLTKGDAQIISQRVANALPLRLDEILAFNYGFDSSNRIIDLQAGIRLRIEHGAYQFVAPDDDASEAYVGRGSSYLQVIQRTDQSLAFDPFLGGLKAIEAEPAHNTELGRTRMISGAMGLTAVGVSRRFARLVYPVKFPTTKNTTPVAENELPMRVGLLLADSYADLEKATKSYLDDSSCAASENNSVMCFYFSGRSFVIPEILVKIRGVEKYVPVGTTVHDALNRYTLSPINQIGNTSTGGYSPVLLRWLQPSLCQSNGRYQPASIVFENNSPVTASGLSQWDMPLLKGDELSW
jgi:hypothetical protein